MATIGTEKAGRRADFVCDAAGSMLTVRIRGEIDHHTAASIRREVDARLFERKPKKLILDLSAVSFMDSSGLGLIMGRLSLVRELGGDLVVWNPGREIRAILSLAGMERMVRIEYPPEAAPADGTASIAAAADRSAAGQARRRRSRTATVTAAPAARKEKQA